MDDEKYKDDAWKKMDDLRRANTPTWEPRNDLRVTAYGCGRVVRLEIGEPTKIGLSKFHWNGTTRNISTMRELAHALLEACDFVEQANPGWASNSPPIQSLSSHLLSAKDHLAFVKGLDDPDLATS